MAVNAPRFLAEDGTGDADARESTTDCGHLDGSAPTGPTVFWTMAFVRPCFPFGLSSNDYTFLQSISLSGKS